MSLWKVPQSVLKPSVRLLDSVSPSDSLRLVDFPSIFPDLLRVVEIFNYPKNNANMLVIQWYTIWFFFSTSSLENCSVARGSIGVINA